MGQRLFLALNPDEESRQRLAAYAADLHSVLEGFNPRWIHPDCYHLTLYFFGDVDERKIPFLEQAFSALSGTLLSPLLSLEDPLFLPSFRNPRVLSLRFSLQKPKALEPILREAQAAAYEYVDRQVGGPTGAQPKLKPWLPHLSIARFRDTRANFRNAGAPGLELTIPKPPKVELNPASFELMESFLYASGARYKIRRSYSFTSA